MDLHGQRFHKIPQVFRTMNPLQVDLKLTCFIISHFKQLVPQKWHISP